MVQPAVPLWKVIAGLGRQELQPGPQGPGFFFSALHRRKKRLLRRVVEKMRNATTKTGNLTKYFGERLRARG